MFHSVVIGCDKYDPLALISDEILQFMDFFFRQNIMVIMNSTTMRDNLFNLFGIVHVNCSSWSTLLLLFCIYNYFTSPLLIDLMQSVGIWTYGSAWPELYLEIKRYLLKNCRGVPYCKFKRCHSLNKNIQYYSLSAKTKTYIATAHLNSCDHVRALYHSTDAWNGEHNTLNGIYVCPHWFHTFLPQWS